MRKWQVADGEWQGSRAQASGIGGKLFDRPGLSVNSQLSTLNSQPSTRAAFTLLEVLVALGLSVILLTAVYAAISLTFRLTTAGREEMEQSQLVRALFQQIDADVRSVVFAVQKEVAKEEEPAAEEDEETTVEPMTTDDAFANASSGVYGDSQNLVLHVSRPTRQSIFVATDSGTASAGRSDLAAVSYFLAIRGASGLPGKVAQLAYDGGLLNAPPAGTVSGLTRLEGDRMAVQFANETGDVETLAAAAQVLAPEVVSLSFAYWDGLEWSENWDTVVSGALPLAIEITLGVDTAKKDDDGVGNDSLSDRIRTTSSVNDAHPTYYRHVVALPLSEPYTGEL